VPTDPSGYAQALLELPCFDVLNLTDEDRQRGEMYRQEAERKQWQQAAPTNLDEYHRSLEMRATLDQPDGYAVPRVAQLTQRTNQFNFTTRRYSEGDIRALLADPSVGVYTIGVEDRFGKLGVVGAAIIRRESSVWELDTFLMSCRALGRGAEEWFLSELCSEAETAGAKLRGEFIPSAKNAPARQFLERLRVPLTGDGGPNCRFEISAGAIDSPSWIARAERSAHV
jgi:FkbH-like protein